MSKLRYFSNIDRTDLEWLWPGRIPLGKLTLLSGDPGLGKGLLTIDIAARVSWGLDWPNNTGTAPQGGVILFSAEDGISDTVAKRLDAAEADDKCIAVLETELDEACDDEADTQDLIEDETEVKHKAFNLETDVPRLEVAIREMNAVMPCRLVVIDPINEYTGRVNTHRNDELRARILRPLGRLAQRHNVAVLIVTHLNKNAVAPAQYRSGGSIAFAAAARSTLMVSEDPEVPGARLLLTGKTNVGEKAASLRYNVAPSTGAPDATAKVFWDSNPVLISTEEALEFDGEAEDAKVEAETWVKRALKDGPLSVPLLRERKPKDLSWRAVKRALGAFAEFDGGRKREWSLRVAEEAN